MDFITMCSKIESEITSLKGHINYVEYQRIALMLKGFEEDEVRLKSCIEEIQTFHRDMFVLPLAEEKQSALLKKDNTKSNLTEPGCSGDKPSNSMDKSEPSQPRLTLKISKYLVSNTYSPENDSDAESFDIEDQLSKIIEDQDTSGGIKSDDVKDSSDSSKSASDSSKSGSDSSKSELSDGENELGKTLLLGLLADRESKITGVLLHLISKFSSFQRNLRKVEVHVSQIEEVFPSASIGQVKKLFKNLSGSVLYLDKTISNAYGIYLEMLHDLIQ